MRWLLTFLIALTVNAFGQNTISGINISFPSAPGANSANWGTGSSILTISANVRMENGRVLTDVEAARILVFVRRGGVKVCGSYNTDTAPLAGFSSAVKVWSGSSASSLIGETCTLQPGNYELVVQFFGQKNGKVIALSDEKTKTFTINAIEQGNYQSPQLMAPVNETVMNEQDLSKPMTFRWTPLIPKPKEPVTYRVTVWQLMQGQNAGQAKTVNKPILIKDIANLTQVTISNLLTGPCKPPYLCDFVWNVQALNRDGKPIGGKNGTSEMAHFSFQSSNIAATPLRLISPINGVSLAPNERMVFAWLPPTPITSTPSYKIKMVEIMGDQSPEQALRTNKPIFEKDSGNWIHTNKPIFEKDSGNWIRTNKPFFEKDSGNWIHTNKPIFEKDSGNWIRTNKPFFEKDTLYYAPDMSVLLIPGKQYAWSLSVSNLKGKEEWSNPAIFSVKNQRSYVRVNGRYKGEIIAINDVAYLEFEQADFPAVEQFEYSIINLSDQKVSPIGVIKLVKTQKLLQLELPVKSYVNPQEHAVLIVGNARKKYYISIKRN